MNQKRSKNRKSSVPSGVSFTDNLDIADNVNDESENSDHEQDQIETVDDFDIDKQIMQLTMGSKKIKTKSTKKTSKAAAPNDTAAALDAASDSDSSLEPNTPKNTVGDIPLQWYKHEEHIGYDREGAKLLRAPRDDSRDLLSRHVAIQDDPTAAVRTIYDAYNDEYVTLSKEELGMIMRIQAGKYPHTDVDPFPEYSDWFTREKRLHPVVDKPVPKARFVPSKWEEKRIVRLVRALRRGWIKSRADQQAEKELKAQQQVGAGTYLMWPEEDEEGHAEHTAAGLAYIPPPKAVLPGHEESYRPPEEYLEAQPSTDDADPPTLPPKSYPSLRKLPQYENFIKERFERCLDLYLCPRIPRKVGVPKKSSELLPALPRPRDLQPYPQQMMVEYKGGGKKVTTLHIDPTGQWLATGSADCTVRVYDVRTGHCQYTHTCSTSISCVRWCPRGNKRILAVCSGNQVYLLAVKVGARSVHVDTQQVLQEIKSASKKNKGEGEDLVQWSLTTPTCLTLTHKFPVRAATWHPGGDYLATVAPTAASRAVLLHHLPKAATQKPFKSFKGPPPTVAFHPSKPTLFLATPNHVSVYSLSKQALIRRLQVGSGGVTDMAVHPSGSHVIVGTVDHRVLWFDIELSSMPHKVMRYHTAPVRAVAVHPTYPLFASCADDAKCHVFHGRVDVEDLAGEPVIVPVKVLKQHKVVDSTGVCDVCWHPFQPWCVTGGGDGRVMLYGR